MKRQTLNGRRPKGHQGVSTFHWLEGERGGEAHERALVNLYYRNVEKIQAYLGLMQARFSEFGSTCCRGVFTKSVRLVSSESS